MSTISVGQAVYRLRRVAPRRLPVLVGRYAWRIARDRARRIQIARNRGELSDLTLQRALGGVSLETAFSAFVQRFFVDPARARETAATLAKAYPRHAQRTRETAQRVLEHVFDLLGSGPTSLGDRIDWQRDFRSGFTWSRDVLPDDQDTLLLDVHCDIKIPWELSRCHQFVVLGRAYAIEQDARYAAEFVAQLQAWLDDNPWPYGVNWSRAMEVAVRAVNWIWAAALFADAPEFTPAVRQRFLKAMLQHGNHILNNLEFADRNGNHYLSNGVGLVFVGVLFSEFADSVAWRRKGFEIVWGEIEKQVHPDGVDFEQGIGYHGLVTEFLYSCVLLCDRNGIPVPPTVRERLGRMFDFMLAYTRPDGSFPQIGDNDDGRLAAVDDEPVGSHRRHLAVGGVMFARPELVGAAADALETAAWLCGPDVLRAQGSEPPSESRSFPVGGFYFMRTADTHLSIDAGEIGMRGIGGHGHADVLSFGLWAAGAGVLVDSGTYTYSADRVMRQALRATSAHNVIRIDGQDSSRLGIDRWLWLIENDAHPSGISWSSDVEHDQFIGSHDGYRRLQDPVTVTRKIVLSKRRLTWRIEDTVEGLGDHLVEVFFHPGVPFDRHDDAVQLHAPRGDVWLFGPSNADCRQEQGWISRGYGLREPATVLVYSTRASPPMVLRTTLLLVPTGTSRDLARSQLEADP